MNEIWKDIKEYEGLYQVSNLGRVKRVETDRILKGQNNSTGYLRVRLYKNNIAYNMRVHRLVAEAFIPNPDNKPQVNHIDEDKTNNSLANLEWMTAKENNNHGTRNERLSKAIRKAMRKSTRDSISKSNSIPIIATNIKTGESTEFYGSNECSRQLELHVPNITAVLKGRLRQTGRYTFKYKEV